MIFKGIGNGLYSFVIPSGWYTKCGQIDCFTDYMLKFYMYGQLEERYSKRQPKVGGLLIIVRKMRLSWISTYIWNLDAIEVKSEARVTPWRICIHVHIKSEYTFSTSTVFETCPMFPICTRHKSVGTRLAGKPVVKLPFQRHCLPMLCSSLKDLHPVPFDTWLSTVSQGIKELKQRWWKVDIFLV